MIETTETPEDVEQALADARRALQQFEDGVDSRRLLLRLRTASPAHPVLLARFAFAVMTFLCVVAGVVVMVITVVNNDLARTLARFEQVIPVPEGIPALPAVLSILAMCMFLAWLMATLAALAIGRDATMLPWEQKQHQKLVNEVTRLTTQKAVMERIRATPAGARPRIATPVPAMRGRQPTPGGSVLGRGGFGRTPARSPRSDDAPSYAAQPSGGSGAGGFGPAGGGFSRTSSDPAQQRSSDPSSGRSFGAAPPSGSSGGFGRSRANTLATPPGAPRGATQGYSAPPPVDEPPPGHGAPAGYSAPETPSNGGGQPAYSAPVPPPEDDIDLIQEEEEPTGHDGGGVRLGGRAPAPRPQDEQLDDYADLIEIAPDEEESDGGILSKARANRATPYGSAGRVRPPPRGGPSTRGGTPLGAAPKAGAGVGSKPRLAPPLGFPGTPDRSSDRSNVPSGIFGTPPPISRQSAPPKPAAARTAPSAKPQADEAYVMEETDPNPSPDAVRRRIPTWGPVEDEWLRQALRRAEELVRSFPIQAYLEFSQEPNLPFTLVIARATPAMAVRAMVNYVEFLASIYTPPRGRIELVNVSHLDRSFHKNVQAALEPYFGDNVEVEPNPGRVDIRFTDPDPGWGAWPTLPIER